MGEQEGKQLRLRIVEGANTEGHLSDVTLGLGRISSEVAEAGCRAEVHQLLIPP